METPDPRYRAISSAMAGCHLRERRYDGADDKQRAFFDRLGEFCTYIGRNSEEIPNYGERYRCGEPISTATAEATVNQVISKRMVKKQQMRWSPRGAHLLLQVRTRVLKTRPS